MIDLHGRQGSTSLLVECCVYSSEDTALGSKSRVPSFFVEMDVLAIEFVEEARVANMQLVWGDSDDGTYYSMST
jgi:hypothetical protein